MVITFSASGAEFTSCFHTKILRGGESLIFKNRNRITDRFKFKTLMEMESGIHVENASILDSKHIKDADFATINSFKGGEIYYYLFCINGGIRANHDTRFWGIYFLIPIDRRDIIIFHNSCAHNKSRNDQGNLPDIVEDWNDKEAIHFLIVCGPNRSMESEGLHNKIATSFQFQHFNGSTSAFASFVQRVADKQAHPDSNADAGKSNHNRYDEHAPSGIGHIFLGLQIILSALCFASGLYFVLKAGEDFFRNAKSHAVIAKLAVGLCGGVLGLGLFVGTIIGRIP